MASYNPNPYRGCGLTNLGPELSPDATAVAALLAQCPRHAETPLRHVPALAQACGVTSLYVKDESQRMGLGSFKALGAAHVIARDAAARAGDMAGRTYVAASAGNHGLSVAAGAAVFGARAVIYLSDTVPESFAERLRQKGADVVRAGATYEDSMNAAEKAADDNNWQLLSDSTWEGYVAPAIGVMEGYMQMGAECVRQMQDPPTHILLQAGVGGMAAAFSVHARTAWGDDPTIIIVEPEAAPALRDSIAAGKLVTASGPVSDMGRLDCKTPSKVALGALSRDADAFVTLSEEEAADGVAILARHGLHTTTSGGAGLAALIAGLPGIGADARVLGILSEGGTDG